MYFSGSLMTFRARDFYFEGPLKYYISVFTLTLKNLMYFSEPTKRPLRQELVYFSGSGWCSLADQASVL